MNASAILKQYFGYDNFRLGQREVIDAILEGRDALAIMPTGAGKSLCFQVPALLMDGITLVISPLISLMQDQVNALIQSGVPAAYINSSLTVSQTYKALSKARSGAYRIIYVAPERLEAPSFQEFVKNAVISMIAVDEAHCVSHWGQDFRPSYLQINDFVAALPKRPAVTAFTATATDLVKDDIIRLLGLKNPFMRSTGFNRENLYFEVRHPKDKFAELESYLRGYEAGNTRKTSGGEAGFSGANPTESGIIYCATRKTVDEVASRLNAIGIHASRYHAGMGQEERTAAQLDFIHDRTNIIVATNAFGMGIDKSNVAFVVHYNMPKNMESYYQEAGRAGRDGSPAECILLFSRQDIMINQLLIEKNDQAEATDDYRRLREMETYCTTTKCLRQHILDYFHDDGQYKCGYCSNCRTGHKLTDVTVDAQKILSCVYRMRGRFGLAMVIDVLRGAQTKKVMGARLNSLKTYGIMEGYPADEIRQIAHFLIQQGYIHVAGDKYPVLQTADKAFDVLSGGAVVEMPLMRAAATDIKPKTKDKTKTEPDTEYLIKLKELRLKLAKAEGVPAFVIFSDAALRDMCDKLPMDDESFLSVSGVGEVKLKKYGSVFLEAIRMLAEK